MTIGLILLFIVSSYTILVLYDTFPDVANSTGHIQSISSAIGFVSYWDILLYIFCLLLIVPVFYLGYLKNHTIPDKKKAYHFKGAYNARYIIKYVEELEQVLSKRFSKFKKLIEQCDKDSPDDIRKHAEVIDSIIFCIKLNGQRRLTIFWNYSDFFLKVIILLLPVVVVSVVLISHNYFGLTGLVLSLILMLFILPITLTIFTYFLQFFQYIQRKRGETVPALSLAFFALEALNNRNVSRAFNKKTGEYFYYTTVHEYNNSVNADSHPRGDSVLTSSSIYGYLKEQAISENYTTVAKGVDG